MSLRITDEFRDAKVFDPNDGLEVGTFEGKEVGVMDGRFVGTVNGAAVGGFE